MAAVSATLVLVACDARVACDDVGFVEQAGTCVPLIDARPDPDATTEADGTTADATPTDGRTDSPSDAQTDAPLTCTPGATYYRDQDGDGLGDPAWTTDTCPDAGSPWVANADDPQPNCPDRQGDGCTPGEPQCIPRGNTRARQLCVTTDPSTGCTAWQDDLCPSSDAPLCDSDTAACGKCETSDDCAGFGDTPVCDLDSGTCVVCGPGETEQCDGKACNALTHVCSAYEPGEVGVCEACDADEACEDGYGCVAMDYAGQPHGSYCLEVREPTCTRPYVTALLDRQSASSGASRDFCGVAEGLTTCESTNALVDDITCGVDADCPDGGLCRANVGNLVNRCTYECDGARQCPLEPSEVSTCGNAFNGGQGPDYCGGEDPPVAAP